MSGKKDQQREAAERERIMKVRKLQFKLYLILVPLLALSIAFVFFNLKVIAVLLLLVVGTFLLPKVVRFWSWVKRAGRGE